MNTDVQFDARRIQGLLWAPRTTTVSEALETLAPLAEISSSFDAGSLKALFHRVQESLLDVRAQELGSLDPAKQAYLISVVARAVGLMESVRLNAQSSRDKTVPENASSSGNKSNALCHARCQSQYESCEERNEIACAFQLSRCKARCDAGPDMVFVDAAVVLWEHSDRGARGGRSQPLKEGVYNDLGEFNFDEITSSITVMPGYRITVWNNKGGGAQREDFVSNVDHFDEFGISSCEVAKR
jgi:hypothetical protein